MPHHRHATLALPAAVSIAMALAACSSGSQPAPAHVSPSTAAHVPTPSAAPTTSVAGVGTIVDTLHPGGYLDGIAVADGTLWATDVNGDRVVRVDASTRRRLPDIVVPEGPLTIVAGRGAVWVASYNGNLVTRFDAKTGARTATVTTPSQGPCGLALVGNRLWVFDQSDGAGVLVDARTGSRVRNVETPALAGLASYAFGSVWVPDFAGRSGTVQRVDASTGLREPAVQDGEWRRLMATSGAGSVWVANTKANTVSRIDPTTGRIRAQIAVPGAGPDAVLVTNDAAWVAGYASDTVYRVDLATNRVVGALPLPGAAQNLATAGGLLWVTMSSGQLAAIRMAG